LLLIAVVILQIDERLHDVLEPQARLLECFSQSPPGSFSPSRKLCSFVVLCGNIQRLPNYYPGANNPLAAPSAVIKRFSETHPKSPAPRGK
jgi:hypothetical protein